MGISCHIQPYTHALHIHKCTHTQTHMQVKLRALFVLLKEYVTHMKASWEYIKDPGLASTFTVGSLKMEFHSFRVFG